jgi:hypothetical protein
VTGEPPPPKEASVVNLYTREYFELLHARLRPGGVASYWPPVHALHDDDTKAIIAAFCSAFSDCTLWSGAGLDWILVGTRGARGPASEAEFAAQWSDPKVAAELRDRGLEDPSQLAALFLAGTDDLLRWSAAVEPVTDDHPRRIGADPIWCIPIRSSTPRCWTPRLRASASPPARSRAASCP